MVRSRLFLPIACLLFCVFASPVRAEWDWNPLDLPIPGLKKDRRDSRRHKPSTLEKLNYETKKFVSTSTQKTKDALRKTKEAITPWKEPPPKPIRRSVTGLRKSTRANPKKEEKKSIFSSWFLPEEPEPRRIRSVSDWMAQPRPGY